MADEAQNGPTPPAGRAGAAADAVLTRDVFITYATADVAVARSVCNALEYAGVTCWMAPRDVMPGDFYGNAIVHAIDRSKVSVLVLSANATASPHVLIEVERATSKRHPVITLRLDDAKRPASFEYFLNASQWLDAADQHLSSVLPRLVESITSLLAKGRPEYHESAAVQLGAVTGTASQRSWKLAAACIVVVSMGFAGYRYYRLHLTAAPQIRSVPATAETSFSPPAHSIAVLPLVNMSGDASQDYFSDGISEELLDSLARISELQVAAATSSFSFKSKELDIRTIARKLNVAAILEGSFRRVGNEVRINVQLINAITGFQMWSQTYDRDLIDILKLQTEVATTVTGQLKVKLVSAAVERIELGSTNNPDAYDSYLHGMQLFYRPNSQDDDMAQALAAFDEAIALDPNYAAAYVRKVAVLFSTPREQSGPNSRNNQSQRAKQAAERAIAIAPQYGEAHAALGAYFAFGAMDFVKATREYQLAATLAPGSAYVQRIFGSWMSFMGYFDAAIAAGKRTVALDPQNYSTYVKLANIYKNARRYNDALDALRIADVLVPNTGGVKSAISDILLATGKYKEAREICESPAFSAKSDKRAYCLALAYHGLGLNAESTRELEKLIAKLGDDEQSYYLAFTYAQLGDTKAALQWLATAEKQRDPRLAELKVTWDLDPVRSDPAFAALVARLKFPAPGDLYDPKSTVVSNQNDPSWREIRGP